jgi:hypothetical protein
MVIWGCFLRRVVIGYRRGLIVKTEESMLFKVKGMSFIAVLVFIQT